MPRKIFVTTALPYANGPFHIGHIMEYIQADIWVRFQRMQGHEVHFVGADDAHGAPIMLKAEAEGITPQQLVARIAAERAAATCAASTSASITGTRPTRPENTELSQEMYRRLKAAGLIYAQVGRAVLRPGQGHVPAGSLHQGRMPELPLQGPVRGRLRGVRHRLRAHRAHQPLLGALGRQARAAQLGPFLLPPLGSEVRAVPERLARRTRAPAAARWSTRRASG